MADVYGANPRLIICLSTSYMISNLESEFPEVYKREFKNEIEFGDLAVIPVTPRFKLAVINAENNGKLYGEILNLLLDATFDICLDYGVSDIRYANDFPEEYRRIVE